MRLVPIAPCSFTNVFLYLALRKESVWFSPYLYRALKKFFVFSSLLRKWRKIKLEHRFQNGAEFSDG
jgi:hypothetical protein